MKKKIFGGIAVLAIAAITAFNINLNLNGNKVAFLSLAGIEALAGETKCYTDKAKNSGICKDKLNKTGKACVATQGWESKDCYGHG